MLYLIHNDGQGNPVGAWNQNAESFYAPGSEYFKGRGHAIVLRKHPERSWADFTEALSTSFSPHNNFHVEDRPEAPLNEVLNNSVLSSQFPDTDGDSDAGNDTDADGDQ